MSDDFVQFEQRFLLRHSMQAFLKNATYSAFVTGEEQQLSRPSFWGSYYVIVMSYDFPVVTLPAWIFRIVEFLVSAIIAESSTDLWLLRQLDTKQARVAVIGLGYVGLPLAVGFARAGFKVFGIDNDSSKIESLSRGQSYIGDVPSFSLEPLIKKETFQPTTDANALAEADVIIICVPTPLRKTKEPDISYI
jgi:threonine dehydrogenase-like Zn-dependent dehydrogenase